MSKYIRVKHIRVSLSFSDPGRAEYTIVGNPREASDFNAAELPETLAQVQRQLETLLGIDVQIDLDVNPDKETT